MSGTKLVRGQGGGIFEMTIPPLGTNRREIFDYMLAKGDLSYVTDEVEEFETRGGGTGLRLKHEPTTHWAAEDPGELDKLDRDQLLSVARARGVEVDGRLSAPKLLKAIQEAEDEEDGDAGEAPPEA